MLIPHHVCRELLFLDVPLASYSSILYVTLHQVCVCGFSRSFFPDVNTQASFASHAASTRHTFAVFDCEKGPNLHIRFLVFTVKVIEFIPHLCSQCNSDFFFPPINSNILDICVMEWNKIKIMGKRFQTPS